jgi:DNA repair protein RadC
MTGAAPHGAASVTVARRNHMSQNKQLPLIHTPKRTINEAALPYCERPDHRLQHLGARALSTPELLSLIIGGANSLDTAYRVMEEVGQDLPKATVHTLKHIRGIGDTTANRIVAALDLSRRAMQAERPERPRITSPADAANLLLAEMQHLEQEHFRLILLDTRNRVLGTPILYIGSLNTSVIRIAEIFKEAAKINAAAIILVHNHPSGDPSPSPEDVGVTRQIVQAGKLLSIDILDHIIIGQNQFVSLKERGLGFDT